MQRPGRRYRRGARAPSARDALALMRVGVVYWLGIYPQVRRELAGWERRAGRIPDRVMREQALGKLDGERLNPEAAALFAVLSPLAQRRRLVSLIVAYQVLYDYLDGVNEAADGTALRNGLQLHRALTEAVLPDRPMSDYYLHHPKRGDGGYMRALTDACRQIVRTLPSFNDCEPVLWDATERCGQAQSHNHALLSGDNASLIRWSLAQAPDRSDYLWWELAAGGISCLGIHALLACAANPESTPRDALTLDKAYFPAICAISALLDSLADYETDANTSNHSFIAHYRNSRHASERLIAITAEARERIKVLRHSQRHAIILAGISSYYLSCSSVRGGFSAPVAEDLARSVGSLGGPMRAVMRIRRYLHRPRRRNAGRRISRDNRLLFLKG